MINTRFRSSVLALTIIASLSGSFGDAALAQKTGAQLAPTPPMGWNSWDSYGPAIREDEVKANVDAMAAKLKQSGWQYIIVDIEWYQPEAHATATLPGAK